jgi:hypothetical protein
VIGGMLAIEAGTFVVLGIILGVVLLVSAVFYWIFKVK